MRPTAHRAIRGVIRPSESDGSTGAAFVRYLLDCGWDISTENQDHPDVSRAADPSGSWLRSKARLRRQGPTWTRRTANCCGEWASARGMFAKPLSCRQSCDSR
jgi:hypothetical protein